MPAAYSKAVAKVVFCKRRRVDVGKKRSIADWAQDIHGRRESMTIKLPRYAYHVDARHCQAYRSGTDMDHENSAYHHQSLLWISILLIVPRHHLSLQTDVPMSRSECRFRHCRRSSPSQFILSLRGSSEAQRCLHHPNRWTFSDRQSKLISISSLRFRTLWRILLSFLLNFWLAGTALIFGNCIEYFWHMHTTTPPGCLA